MTYLLVKWLHILSSTVHFGTGLGSAFYMFFASRTRNAQAIAVVTRHVVIADWMFTTSSRAARIGAAHSALSTDRGAGRRRPFSVDQRDPARIHGGLRGRAHGRFIVDTSYAQPRRYISPVEQHIHSYQDTLPLFAPALACVLHWDAVAEPVWSWSLRPQPLPWTWGVVLALCPGLLMIVEELMCCLRTARVSQVTGEKDPGEPGSV
jgi:hypothetical protein